MPFNLSTIMDGIATEMITDIGATFRAYGWPIGNPTSPCAIVGYPTELEYDFTAHGIGTTGKVRAVFPVRYIAGQAVDKATRDAISAVLTGTAPLGIPESLGGNLAGAVDTVRVSTAPRFEQEMIGDTPYMAVIFDVEVIA